MPDITWVELIKSAYGDIEEPYSAFTAASFNRAVGKNRFLAASMDNTTHGNQWDLFCHQKHNGTRNVTCYIAVERDAPLGPSVEGKVWWDGVTEHQNPVRLFADEVKLFAADTVESTLDPPLYCRPIG